LRRRDKEGNQLDLKVVESGNDYLFCIPYTPKTDAIEEYFNQIKTYLKKNRNVENYQQLENNVNIIHSIVLF